MSMDVPQVDGGGGVNDSSIGKVDEAVFGTYHWNRLKSARY